MPNDLQLLGLGALVPDGGSRYAVVMGYPDGGGLTNGLALSDHPWAEQVELYFPGDAGDGWLAGPACGEVSGLPGLAGAGAVRTVTNEEAGHEDLGQERG